MKQLPRRGDFVVTLEYFAELVNDLADIYDRIERSSEGTSSAAVQVALKRVMEKAISIERALSSEDAQVQKDAGVHVAGAVPQAQPEKPQDLRRPLGWHGPLRWDWRHSGPSWLSPTGILRS